MTPADRRELCAILRRVFDAAVGYGGLKTAAQVEIDAIEKEIEPCSPTPTSGDWRLTMMGPTPFAKPATPTSETIGAPSAAVTGGTSSPMRTDAPHKSNASGATQRDAAPPDCRTSPPDMEYEMAKDPASYQRFPQIVDDASETSGAESAPNSILSTGPGAKARSAPNAIMSTPTNSQDGPSRPTIASSSPETDAASRSATASTAPPDLAAIRQAVERLRAARGNNVCMDFDYAPSVYRAVDAILALDVPGVVERWAERYATVKDIARDHCAGERDWKQRAEAAEARCPLSETGSTQHMDRILSLGAQVRAANKERDDIRVQRDQLVELRDRAEARAEKAEQERDEARLHRDELQRGVFKMENAHGITYRGLTLQQLQDRCEAFEIQRFDVIEERYLRQIQEARDKALEEAAARTDAQARDFCSSGSVWDVLRDLAAAIRAMKGKP